MAQRSASRLLDLDPVDHPDKHDEVYTENKSIAGSKIYQLTLLLQEMAKCYEEFLANTSTMSTNELHAYVHDTVSRYVGFASI